MIQINVCLGRHRRADRRTIACRRTNRMTVRGLARRDEVPTTVIGSPCGTCEIREISVCGALAPAEIERLRAIIATVHYDPGQIVISEGEPAENLFNVISGTVRLHKLLP